MTNMPLVFIAAALALCQGVEPARAQLARTFVSATVGSDANDCNRLTPCRTFQHAHDTTLANGEITVLDAGGYGAVTITKSVSIIDDGVGEAGVLVSGGGTGITVNAGADGRVSLRGLTLKGLGFGGGVGIVFNTGRSLTIENCAIRNFDGAFPLGSGVLFNPTGSSSLSVTNTIVADNEFTGVRIQPVGLLLSTTAVFNRIEAYNNGASGVLVDGESSTGTINVTVAESVAAGNGTGFRAFSGSGQAGTTVTIIRSVAASNSQGVRVGGAANALLRLGQSTLSGNTVTWVMDGTAVLQSYGNNRIDGNADGSPALPMLIARK